MNSLSVAAWAVPFATALVGLVGGALWHQRRSSASQADGEHEVISLRAELDEQRQLASRLEIELHTQRAHTFALESDIEARESDWSRLSPTPVSFDAQTFQIERQTQADPASWPVHQGAHLPRAPAQVIGIVIEGLAQRIDSIRNDPNAGARPELIAPAVAGTVAGRDNTTQQAAH